jgi:hypothetical protein
MCYLKTSNTEDIMRIQLSFFFLILTLHSCVPTPATEQQKRAAMNNAHFDPNVIKNIDKYEILRAFLEQNIDTIIKFRYSKNVAVLVGGEGHPDSNYLADDKCYVNNRYDTAKVPDHLKIQLSGLFQSFDDKDIITYEICKDKRIRILVKVEEGENGLFISHDLLWNTIIERDYYYKDNKDTLLNNKCIYRIGLTEHHGH